MPRYALLSAIFCLFRDLHIIVPWQYMKAKEHASFQNSHSWHMGHYITVHAKDKGRRRGGRNSTWSEVAVYSAKMHQFNHIPKGKSLTLFQERIEFA